MCTKSRRPGRQKYHIGRPIFTALHALHETPSSHEKAGCLCVCQTRVDCDKMKERSAQIFLLIYTTWKNVYPSFANMKNGWWGRLLLPGILGQVDPVGEKTPIFNRYSLVKRPFSVCNCTSLEESLLHEPKKQPAPTLDNITNSPSVYSRYKWDISETIVIVSAIVVLGWLWSRAPEACKCTGIANSNKIGQCMAELLTI